MGHFRLTCSKLTASRFPKRCIAFWSSLGLCNLRLERTFRERFVIKIVFSCSTSDARSVSGLFTFICVIITDRYTTKTLILQAVRKLLIGLPPLRCGKTGRGTKALQPIEGVEKWGGDIPSPSDYGVWGSVVSSPSGVRGKTPENFDF